MVLLWLKLVCVLDVFLCFLSLMYAVILLPDSSGNRVATYWEIAAHTTYNMLS